MTDDRRSIREIEADLERHRAELTYNIDLLQSKLSVDGAVRQIKQRDRSIPWGAYCRSGLYSLPVLAKERQDALENQY